MSSQDLDCRGDLDLVGADLVEVSPPLDHSGTTALVGASIAFELLCLLAEAHADRNGHESRARDT